MIPVAAMTFKNEIGIKKIYIVHDFMSNKQNP